MTRGYINYQQTTNVSSLTKSVKCKLRQIILNKISLISLGGRAYDNLPAIGKVT
jgi:hypothetical protein